MSTRAFRRSRWFPGLVVVMGGLHFTQEASAQIGACCLPSGTCLQTDSSGCTAVSGTFRGQGLDCFDSTCQGPCCTPDRDCFEGSQDACAAEDGVFGGFSQFCEDVCALTVETGFVYQGQLRSLGVPIHDTVDLEFALFTNPENGDQIGTPIRLQDVAVANGLFTVTLDFGFDAFDGRPRHLEARVRSPHDPSDAGAFTTLSPRQSIRPTPYALALPGFRTEAVDGPPNVIGGSHHNEVAPGATGAFIGGGGSLEPHRNQVTGSFGVVVGGRINTADAFSFVGGGNFNFADSVGVVGGGDSNSATGLRAFVGGGGSNGASGFDSVVVGGSNNSASGTRSTISGGFFNTAPGAESAVPGGNRNAAGGSFSFAAGRKAKVRTPAQVGAGDTDGDQGTFVWADSTDADFQSTGPNQFLIRAGGGMGVGTNAPEGPLHVFDGSAGTVTADQASIIVGESSASAFLSLLTSSAGERGIYFGQSNSAPTHGGIVYNASTTLNGLQLRTNGNVSRMSIDSSGRVGIGTNAPATTLEVAGSNVVSRVTSVNAVGPVLQTVQSNPATVSSVLGMLSMSLGLPNVTDSRRFEISYGNNTNESLRFSFAQQLQGQGTSISEKMRILENGNVGIATTTPGNKLSVLGSADFTGFVGFGVAAPDTPVDAARSGGPVGAFNRLTNDGTVIAIQQDGVNEGTISVSGNTVSYNAFTGSHYAWTDREILPGALVSLNGNNRHLGDRKNSEVLYGIDITTRANDPACLGVFSGLEEPTRSAGSDNPHLVAAVGNGELCLVDRGGGDIEPGDYLISSDVPGCAMKDDPARFAVGHVIAKAADRIRWAEVVADEHGLKRAKASVLFGAFVRAEDTAELRNRIERLEAAMRKVEEAK